MSDKDRERGVTLTVAKNPDGSAQATLWIRMRSGIDHKAASMEWARGAPTPAQLELLEGTVLQAVHDVVLMTCGVWGILTPNDPWTWHPSQPDPV